MNIFGVREVSAKSKSLWKVEFGDCMFHLKPFYIKKNYFHLLLSLLIRLFVKTLLFHLISM